MLCRQLTGVALLMLVATEGVWLAAKDDGLKALNHKFVDLDAKALELSSQQRACGNNRTCHTEVLNKAIEAEEYLVDPASLKVCVDKEKALKSEILLEANDMHKIRVQIAKLKLKLEHAQSKAESRELGLDEDPLLGGREFQMLE